MKKLIDIFKNHPSIMLVIEPEKEKIYKANKSALEFFQIEDKAIFLSELLNREENKIEQKIKSCLIKKNINFPINTKTDKNLEINSTTIYFNNKEYLLWIIHDVTKRKELKHKLKLKKKELEKLNRNLQERVEEEVEKRIKQENFLIQQSKMASMGEMIGAITHQWKQPLNTLSTLILNIDLQYQFNHKLTHQEIEEFMNYSNKQINFMSKTIDDFRNFFNPKKQKETFDIKKAIEDIIFIVSTQLNFHSIELSISESSFELHNYLNEFKQVILNLINNAKDEIIKKRENNRDFIGKIHIEIFKYQKRGFIKVTDNAGGVPDEIIDKIFESHFTTKSDGTGIGLYMSKMIIEGSIGGEISVKNNDYGAEFTIEISDIGF